MSARVVHVWVAVALAFGAGARAQPAPEPLPTAPPAPLPYVPPRVEPDPNAPPPEVAPPAPSEVAPPVEGAPPAPIEGVPPVEVVPALPVTARTIGVLLPLSGAQEKLGRGAREAIEVAAARVPGVRLVVRDTGSDPIRAAAEAEKLVTEEHVTALLGPIARRECAAVTAVARRFVVPLVVLASVVEPAPDAAAAALDAATPDPVRRLRTSPREQAEAVARHARLALGVARVAIVHPTSEAGMEAAQAFAAELTRLGGTVQQQVGYAPGETSFKDVLPALMNAKRPGKKVAAAFDAVFLPDQAQAAVRLAGQLAAWGVPLRRSPGPAAGRVQLLGMGGWGNALVIDRATGLTENAVFAEPWAPERADATFVPAFTARWNKPPVAFHAEAFDAATWLLTAVDAHDGADQALRLAVLATLSGPSSFAGATGVVAIEAGRVAPRVHLMTVHGAAIRERLGEDEELLRRTAPPPAPAAGDAPAPGAP